jgi:hypothetical protein
VEVWGYIMRIECDRCKNVNEETYTGKLRTQQTSTAAMKAEYYLCRNCIRIIVKWINNGRRLADIKGKLKYNENEIIGDNL